MCGLAALGKVILKQIATHQAICGQNKRTVPVTGKSKCHSIKRKLVPNLAFIELKTIKSFRKPFSLFNFDDFKI